MLTLKCDIAIKRKGNGNVVRFSFPLLRICNPPHKFHQFPFILIFLFFWWFEIFFVILQIEIGVCRKVHATC